MKKYANIILTAILGVATFTACDDYETYAEQKEAEVKTINNFIARHGIRVIDEEQFHKQGDKTDVSRNEFVLFDNTGVYMQIVNEGCGEKIKDGESTTVLARFDEYNVAGDSLYLTNKMFDTHHLCDKFTVTNYSGTFYGTFINGTSLMYQIYNSQSVPSAWLLPLAYIKLGRPEAADQELARVRLLVPHDQGNTSANKGIYANYYDLTYMRGL